MKRSVIACALVALAATQANAASISGTGNPLSDPALSGGTQIDFSDQAIGSYNSLTVGNVTIGGPISVSAQYGGNYNTTGRYIHNDSGYTEALAFDFAQAVSAVGFNFGASDNIWTLTAFNGTNVLGSIDIPVLGGNNDGGFFGFAASGITHVNLTTNGYDYVLLDNLTYKLDGATGAVPEPATWALMILGFGAIGGALRRSRPKMALSYS